MRYDLARRLTNREPGSPDINPDGLSLADIKKLDISAEDWQLLIDIESDGRRRPEVLALAQDKMDNAERTVDLQTDFDAVAIANSSIEHLRDFELTQDQWFLVLNAEMDGKNRAGAIDVINAKIAEFGAAETDEFE